MKFKILPGSYNSHNSFSSEIGWQGLLACGNNNYVQIVDPKSGQLVQTLEKHNNVVHLVKWAPENFYHDLKKSYSLKLATADISGMIVVWDATYATVLSDFCCQGKKVLDFQWMKHQEVSIDFIVALHTGGELILWNTDSGNRVWCKTYPHQLLDFTVDNHDFNNLAFRGDNFILLVSDFSLTRAPDSNGRKFFICNAGESTPDTKTPSINRLVVSKSAQLIKATARLVMDLGGGSSENLKNPSNGGTQSSSNCIQILYHAYCQNHIILVYTREILIMDLMIFQAVASISLDRSTPSFIKVYSCWQNDLLYCLHENGIVTIRGRRPVVVYEDGEISASQKVDHEDLHSPESSEGQETRPILIKLSQNLPQCLDSSTGLAAIFGWVEAGWYQLLCQTEAPRLTRNLRIIGLSVNPATERTISLITSDTKIQSWELQVSPVYLEVFPEHNSYILGPQNLVRLPIGCHQGQMTISPKILYHMIEPMVDLSAFIEHERMSATIGSYRVLPNESASVTIEGVEKGRIEMWGKLTLIMSSLHQGLLSDPTVLRANPVNMNQTEYPLVAVGNAKGIIQLWNLSTSQLEREYQVMHCPIRGIEWNQVAMSSSSMGQILVYGHNLSGTQTNSPSAKVKNNLSVIPLRTGRIIELRTDAQESPIEMVRVSGQRQYFVVVLKDGPTEIWDCRTLIKLRDIPLSNKPLISLEWSTGSVNTRASRMMDTEGFPVYSKEKYLTIDNAGFMQHIVVEGTLITKGRQVPAESGLNKISTMAYKNNVVVIGSNDGSVLFWYFKNMSSVICSIAQGRIIKILFDNAAGVQSKLVAILSMEGLTVCDLKQSSILKAIKWGKEVNSRILAMDWLDDGQTLVLLAASDIRIVRATSLETSCSVVSFDEYAEPITCLSILPPKILFTIKHYLQHQPWRSTYSVSSDLWEKEEDIVRNLILVNMLKKLSENEELSEFSGAAQPTAKGLALRCYLVAVLLGDEYELKFWAVTLKSFFPDYYQSYLPWEMLWSTDIFRTYQKSRLWSLDRKRTSYKQTQKCAEAFIMLGDLDRSVRLLLETSPANISYVPDLQLACLLANQSSGSDRQSNAGTVVTSESGDSNINAHHSTVKLVATQFISNNCLKEGVQLLCVINKQSDACRYLQTYNEWKTALWLAKCTLSDAEVNEITRQWASNILQSQVATKSNALLQFLALKDHSKVIEILVMGHQYQLATRFVEFSQLLQLTMDEQSATRSKHVFSEFGKFLMNIHCDEAGRYYLGQGEDMCRAID